MATNVKKSGRVSLRAQDIQTGLQEYDIDEFKTLIELGWSARIAIHLRSSGPVEYGRLQAVSDHLFGVSKWGFPEAIDVLQSVDMVRVIGSGDNRQIVPQNIPYFNDLYPALDTVIDSRPLTEHEQLSVDLLDRLARSPAEKHQIFSSMGADKEVFSRVLTIGQHGSYLDEINSGGREILTSPMYFSENPKAFADAVARYGEGAVKKVLDALRAAPGWPLAEVEQGRIGGVTLHGVEIDVARAIAQKAITQPPGITKPNGQTNFFVFTPPVGTDKIAVIEKEVYERAIALVAAIRHGQHYAAWSITRPIALLNKLRRGDPIAPPRAVREQYERLALRKIVRFDPPPPAPFERVVFIDTEENKKAVDLAIEMLTSGAGEPTRTANAGADELLTSSTAYTEFVRGIGKVRSRKQVPRSTPEARQHMDKLLEHCMKGA